MQKHANIRDPNFADPSVLNTAVNAPILFFLSESPLLLCPPTPGVKDDKNQIVQFFLRKILQKMFSREHEKQQKDFSQKLLILDAGGGGGSIPRGFVTF